MDKIKADCIWVILKKGRPAFAQNHLVCGVTIILLVKQFQVSTIFEFKLVTD